MKLYQIIIGLLVGVAFGLLFNKYVAPKIPTENSYAQKFEYKESEINKLKRELDDQRLKSLKLQSELDSCIHFKEQPKVTYTTYTTPKKSKPKVSYKEKYDSTLTLLNQKRIDNANLEIGLTDQINFKNRQLDTCSYYVREMDKALLNMSNDISKLTTQKDSLANILNTPISITKEFPCLKAKKGTVVVATVIPNTGTKDFTVTNFNLPKDKYKVAKKSCKKAQSR